MNEGSEWRKSEMRESISGPSSFQKSQATPASGMAIALVLIAPLFATTSPPPLGMH